MKIQKLDSGYGFGLACERAEGSTVVSIGRKTVTFYDGELDFLKEIPKLSNKSKDKIILAFAKLAAEANTP